MIPRDTVLYWNFIKEDFGMKRLHCFLRKNNFLSLFGNIGVEHNFLFSISKSLISSMETLILFTNENQQIVLLLISRSFMYIKNSNKSKIGTCGTPVLIISQWEFWPLISIIQENLIKSVSKYYQKHLLSSTCISNLHAKPYQKLLASPKIQNAFPKMKSYQKIYKFSAL